MTFLFYEITPCPISSTAFLCAPYITCPSIVQSNTANVFSSFYFYVVLKGTPSYRPQCIDAREAFSLHSAAKLVQSSNTWAALKKDKTDTNDITLMNTSKCLTVPIFLHLGLWESMHCKIFCKQVLNLHGLKETDFDSVATSTWLRPVIWSSQESTHESMSRCDFIE